MTHPARGIIGMHHRLKPTIKITWYADPDPLFFLIFITLLIFVHYVVHIT